MIRTRRREVILDVLHEAKRPLTREEILRLGRQRIQRLGSATVDRAIRQMSAEASVIGVEFPGQPKRYELPASCEHPHFICRQCNRVFDLPVAMQLPQITLPEGFLLKGGEVIYSGICPGCHSSDS